MAKRYLILQGDARQRLKQLPGDSIQMVVTSPPYWGLREYSVSDTWWGGDPGCTHTPVDFVKAGISGGLGVADFQHHYRPKRSCKGGPNFQIVADQHQAWCSECDAWRGQLGQEPTPEMYVKHLVEIFREVHRVLKPDGTVWLNIGDCYAGSGKGLMGDKTQAPRAGEKQATNKGTTVAGIQKMAVPNGAKPKDLVGIPWMVAFALRADGWWLRSDIVWTKPNAFPESVTDRPTRSHEYVFMLAKGASYYYSREAVREEAATSSKKRVAQATFDQQTGGPKDYATTGVNPNRSMRKALENFARNPGRQMRDVLVINTEPSPYEHYASFPLALAEICILAGSRPNDMVLDPMCGISRAGLAALKHGRKYIGIDLGEDYVRFSREQLTAVDGNGSSAS